MGRGTRDKKHLVNVLEHNGNGLGIGADMNKSRFESDVTVIGGCGHVGLPLAMLLANEGLQTRIYDINSAAIEKIRRGEMPFMEEDAEPMLKSVLANKTLGLSDSPEIIAKSRCVVLVTGTPVDEHLNPRVDVITSMLEEFLPHFRDDQVLILRSTLFPGVSEKIKDFFDRHGVRVHVAFCPERVAQGHSIREIKSLPQIISGFDETAIKAASDLFSHLTKELIIVEPAEAELAKLFTNCWRYITFAIVNQFYMTACSFDLDFSRIYKAVTHMYSRAAAMPAPGFAAGPCLFKDTMQLAAFNNNNFFLGHSAMLINEGLPNFVVQQMKKKHPLDMMTVGILGMAFKAECDDPRESLSYKLRKVLKLEARRVLATDPYVDDPSLVPLDQVLLESDVIVVGTPHRRYADLSITKPTIDIWNILKKGSP